MSINFPNDPATSPGDGGQWTDADGNLWQVEIVSGEAVWTMIQAAGSDDPGGGSVSSVAGKTGDVTLELNDLTDVVVLEQNGGQLTTLQVKEEFKSSGVFNPNSQCVYAYAGMRVREDGTAHLCGGESADLGQRSSVISWKGEIRLSDQPWLTTESGWDSNYTIKIETTGTDGNAMSYRAAPTLGTDATDLVIPTMGQVRGAIAGNGGTSVSLNDLTDVNYTQKGSDDSWTLEPINLDEILFQGQDTPAGVTRKLYTNVLYGMAMASIPDGESGSYFYAHETKGIILRVPGDDGVIWIEGDSTTDTSQPEIRLSSGKSLELDPASTVPGNYLGFKMPAGVAANFTWILPATDGLSGYVLSTDGAGNLTFAPPPSPAQAVRTYEIDFESTTAYKFTGPGLDGTELNPTIIVNRGDTYIFNNVLGAHPFQLQTVAGTGESPYTDGVTGDQPISLGSFEWVVPMDAPATIFYQCTAHEAMAGSIHVLDNSGGGEGGGAVDSVNSQVGVVSLGIQDMNDFDLQQSSQGVYSELTSRKNSTNTFAPNEWNCTSSTFYYDSLNPGLPLDNLRIGDQISFGFAGTTYGPYEVTSNPTNSGAGGRKFNVSPDVNAAISGSSVGSSVLVYADVEGFTFADVPPTTNQALVYKETASAFLPTDIANSVNNETGDISLGVQDMNDFELSTGNIYAGNTYKAAGIPSNPGEWGLGNPSQGASFSWYEAQNAAMDLLVSGTAVTFIADGVSPHTTTISQNPAQNSSDSRYLRIANNWPGEWLNLPEGTALEVASAVLPDVPVPIQEGDFLQWDDVNQKFRPVQIAAGGAVDSVNNEIGVVSLGIQDMDDFKQYQVPPTLPFYSSTPSPIPSLQDPGYARYATNFSAPKPFIINEVDSNGVNSRADLLQLSIGDKFWVSFHNGYNWEEFELQNITNSTGSRWDLSPTTPPSQYIPYGSDTPWELAVAQDGPSNWYFSFTEPGELADVPLAEGDLLQWNDGAQKFMPKALAIPGPQRKTVQIVETLDSQETKTGEVTGTGGSGLLLTVQTDVPVWIRLYTDTTSRSTDASRTQGDDPLPGSGVLFEAMYSTVTEKVITPGTTYFNKADDADSLYYAVTNVGATDGAVATINLKILPLEN